MKLIPSIHTLPSGATMTESSISKARSCAVIPNKTQDDEGFIDTRSELGGMKVYVSVTAVKEMGRLVGMSTSEEVQALVDDFEEAVADQKKKYDELKTNAAKVIELEKAHALIAAEQETP